MAIGHGSAEPRSFEENSEHHRVCRIRCNTPLPSAKRERWWPVKQAQPLVYSYSNCIFKWQLAKLYKCTDKYHNCLRDSWWRHHLKINMLEINSYFNTHHSVMYTPLSHSILDLFKLIQLSFISRCMFSPGLVVCWDARCYFVIVDSFNSKSCFNIFWLVHF